MKPSIVVVRGTVSTIGGWLLRACAKPRVAATVSLVLSSCDTPGIRLVDPDVPSDGSTGVAFQVTLEDSALAEALGWSNGVPEATVFLQRVGEPFAPESLTTDSLGQAYINDILPGQFKVAAYRVLAEDETGPMGGVVRAFGDGWIRDVCRGATVPMTLMADNAGSLVFSEWWAQTVPGYDNAKFVELYNNSDTTVYVDGMLIGGMWSAVGAIPDISWAESES